jgi:hypothetical protein
VEEVKKHHGGERMCLPGDDLKKKTKESKKEKKRKKRSEGVSYLFFFFFAFARLSYSSLSFKRLEKGKTCESGPIYFLWDLFVIKKKRKMKREPDDGRWNALAAGSSFYSFFLPVFHFFFFRH